MSSSLLGRLDDWGLGSGPRVQDSTAPHSCLALAGPLLASSPASSCSLHGFFYLVTFQTPFPSGPNTRHPQPLSSSHFSDSAVKW